MSTNSTTSISLRNGVSFSRGLNVSGNPALVAGIALAAAAIVLGLIAGMVALYQSRRRKSLRKKAEAGTRRLLPPPLVRSRSTPDRGVSLGSKTWGTSVKGQKGITPFPVTTQPATAVTRDSSSSSSRPPHSRSNSSHSSKRQGASPCVPLSRQGSSRRPVPQLYDASPPSAWSPPSVEMMLPPPPRSRHHEGVLPPRSKYALSVGEQSMSTTSSAFAVAPNTPSPLPSITVAHNSAHRYPPGSWQSPTAESISSMGLSFLMTPPQSVLGSEGSSRTPIYSARLRRSPSQTSGKTFGSFWTSRTGRTDGPAQPSRTPASARPDSFVMTGVDSNLLQATAEHTTREANISQERSNAKKGRKTKARIRQSESLDNGMQAPTSLPIHAPPSTTRSGQRGSFTMSTLDLATFSPDFYIELEPSSPPQLEADCVSGTVERGSRGDGSAIRRSWM